MLPDVYDNVGSSEKSVFENGLNCIKNKHLTVFAGGIKQLTCQGYLFIILNLFYILRGLNMHCNQAKAGEEV